MSGIRLSCSVWAQRTFTETLDELSNVDPNVRLAAHECFERLGISNKKVNGYACEKLPKTEEGHTGINYTDVFHELNERRAFTPLNYLVELTRRYIEQGGDTKRLDGFIARGIRTLTSLIREPDFAESIAGYLPSDGVRTKTVLHPKQDAKDHTDVLLIHQGNTYRIWLFQFSNRGLPHDIERVTGRRGELPPGIHLLCPLRTEYAIEYVRIVKKLSRTKNKIQQINQDLESCSKGAHKTRDHLENRLNTLKTELDDYEHQLQEISKRTMPELDVVEGWYFYSHAHVERIAKLIHESKKPYSYEQVVEILLAPEQFLSEARMFEKTN